MGSRLSSGVGQVFGRLVVVGVVAPDRASGQIKTRWVCRCECGSEREFDASNVRRGVVKGCGCRIKTGHQSHGMRYTPEYRTWNMMTQRCRNPKNHAWKHYGGRGVTVCDEWASSFEAFYRDMGPRPPGTSIDRIDVNGNYEPGNCRWADAATQAKNQRRFGARTESVEP